MMVAAAALRVRLFSSDDALLSGARRRPSG